jgi:8-oxo-dGTP pyrophosphatase MutT (NUDIX family)
MSTEGSVAAKPAATVTLLREVAEGPQVLLVRRNRKLAFHGGAWVFPGGRVESADFETVDDCGNVVSAARRAAVRESWEEAGVVIDPATLVMFARWITPEHLPKRFDTWFFAARAQGDDVRVDGDEIHEHRWIRPLQALEAHRCGELELPPPTFVTLSQFSTYSKCTDLLRDLETGSVATFAPRIRVVPGGACCLYEGDAAYEGDDVDVAGNQHRLWMLDSGWRYERRGVS